MIWVLAFLSMALNRLRGDDKGFGKLPEKLLLGACVAYPFSFDLSPWVLFSCAFALTLSPGYTDCVGALLDKRGMNTDHRPQWYSPKSISNPWVSMWLRGLVLASLPALVVSWYDLTSGALFFALCSLTYISGMLLARHIPMPPEKWRKWLLIHDQWAWWEVFTGFSFLAAACLS